MNARKQMDEDYKKWFESYFRHPELIGDDAELEDCWNTCAELKGATMTTIKHDDDFSAPVERDDRLTILARLKICLEVLTIRSGHAHTAHEKQLSTGRIVTGKLLRPTSCWNLTISEIALSSTARSCSALIWPLAFCSRASSR